MLANKTYVKINYCLENPKFYNYLEIGVFDGEGISLLSNSHKNKKFYGVDPFIEDGSTSGISFVEKGSPMQNIKNQALENIANSKNITLFTIESKIFKDMIYDQYIKDLNISVVFIDGNHHAPHVQIDADLAYSLIDKKEGAVIFDDINLEDVKDGVDYFLNKYKKRVTFYEEVYGCSFIYLKEDNA